MKTLSYIFILPCFILLGASVFAQQIATAPYSAKYISVNQGGSVWAFGTGAKHGDGLYYKFNNWNFVPYNLSEGIISASSLYGEILITNSKGIVKEWNTNNKRWIPYAGITGVKDAFISKSNQNDKFALGKVRITNGTEKYGLWKVSNISTSASSWVEIVTDDSWAQSFIKATNDVSGNLYFVTSSGRLIARYANANEYSILETQGKFAIDVLVGENGLLYMMERGGTIYKRETNGSWSLCRMDGSSFGVDDKGAVYGLINSEIKKVSGGQVTTITIQNPNSLDASGNTPLTAAVALSDLTGVQKAIDNGTDLNKANQNGDYPVTLAVKLKNTAMVNTLVNNGADFKVKDKSGHTALFYAVQSRDKVLTQAVLLSKVDPNIEDVITAVVLTKDTEMITLLAGYKADLTPGLTKSAELNDTEMFQTLIRAGGKLTTNNAFNLATDRNNLEITKICLDNGTNKKDAITYAIQKGNRAVIGVCLQNGCPAEGAVDFAIAKNDEAFVTELITVYKVNANTVLDKAVLGSKSQNGSKANPKVNIAIATTALENGAKPNPYFAQAVKVNNTELVEVLIMNGGSADKLLAEAVSANSVDYTTFAIDNGANLSKATGLLLKAIENNYWEVAKIMLNAGAPATDKRLIKAAVAKLNIEIVQLLLLNGAPVDDKNLIETAVVNNNAAIAQELLNYGADPNVAIQSAVDKNHTKIVLMMLEAGAIATTPKLIASAAGKGNLEIVSALVQRNANPDEGVIPAISGGKNNIFTFLMDNGANNQSINYVVATVRANRIQMFRYLSEAGAAVAYNDQSNQNLLHLACKNNNAYEIVEILIRKGVEVDQKDNSGNTPLSIAVNSSRNNLDVTTLLVDNGADVNAKNNKGKSVLKVADGKKVKDYLKSKGATK